MLSCVSPAFQHFHSLNDPWIFRPGSWQFALCNFVSMTCLNCIELVAYITSGDLIVPVCCSIVSLLSCVSHMNIWQMSPFHTCKSECRHLEHNPTATIKAAQLTWSVQSRSHRLHNMAGKSLLGHMKLPRQAILMPFDSADDFGVKGKIAVVGSVKISERDAITLCCLWVNRWHYMNDRHICMQLYKLRTWIHFLMLR